MGVLTKRPSFTELHEALTKKEVLNWATEELEQRGALRPYLPPLVGKDDASVPVLGYVPISEPGYSSSSFAHNRDRLGEVRKKFHLHDVAVEDLIVKQYGEGAAYDDAVTSRVEVKVRILGSYRP
jgi:hypothetical protein